MLEFRLLDFEFLVNYNILGEQVRFMRFISLYLYFVEILFIYLFLSLCFFIYSYKTYQIDLLCIGGADKMQNRVHIKGNAIKDR